MFSATRTDLAFSGWMSATTSASPRAPKAWSRMARAASARKTGAPRVATKPPADLDLRPHRVERHQENPAEETCRRGFLPHRPITLAVRVRAARACRDECLVLRCVGPRHRDEANDLRIAVHLEAAVVVGARSRRKEEPPRCKRRLRCGRSWRRHGLPPCSHALGRKGRAHRAGTAVEVFRLVRREQKRRRRALARRRRVLQRGNG